MPLLCALPFPVLNCPEYDYYNALQWPQSALRHSFLIAILLIEFRGDPRARKTLWALNKRETLIQYKRSGGLTHPYACDWHTTISIISCTSSSPDFEICMTVSFDIEFVMPHRIGSGLA